MIVPHSNPCFSASSEMDGGAGTGGGMQDREFIWTDADFDRVQNMIYKRAGISLHNGKHAMVYSRLSRRLRETGYKSFRDYLGWLESSESVGLRLRGWRSAPSAPASGSCWNRSWGSRQRSDTPTVPCTRPGGCGRTRPIRRP